MAAAGLTEELTCAVCLGLYQDPVALPCQHSFCAKCIGDFWDHSESLEGVNCPQCRRCFKPRPGLVKNHTLQNIVEKYSQCQPTAPAARPSPVMCEYCIENPSLAVKTCLKCETSFCSHHLQPHLTKPIYKDHGLIEPIADFTTRQCPTHKKVLEFYCEQDEECVCVSCTIIGKHKSHSLLTVEEAKDKIKEIMKNKLENIHKVQKDWSSEQQDLKQSEIEVKRFSKELKEKLSATFSEWRKRLEEDEKSSLKMIDEEEQRVLSQIKSNSDSLLKKMEEIKIIDKEFQDQEQKDPLSFLQDAKQLLSSMNSERRTSKQQGKKRKKVEQLSRLPKFETSEPIVTQQVEIPLNIYDDLYNLSQSSSMNSERRTSKQQEKKRKKVEQLSSMNSERRTSKKQGKKRKKMEQLSRLPIFETSEPTVTQQVEIPLNIYDDLYNLSENAGGRSQSSSTSQRKHHTMNLSNIASFVKKNFNEYQKYQTTIMDMLR
ncbi:E3 ubiquitin/ISG15 ligase TRIM25-like isoform X2 [Rhinoraja longicauda]